MAKDKIDKIKDDLIEYDENGNIKDMREVELLQPIQKRHFRKGEFYTVGKQLNKLILGKKYTGETFRLLFLLLDKIDYNNRIKSFTQVQLGKELNISQSNVCKGLAILKEDRIIYKEGRDYYFSSEYVKYSGDK